MGEYVITVPYDLEGEERFEDTAFYRDMSGTPDYPLDDTDDEGWANT